MTDFTPYLECRLCRTRQRVEISTDGHGNMVERLVCGCEERRRAGICLDCPKPVEGRIGVALRCAECKRKAQREYSRRYRERHPDRIRKIYDRTNTERRTEAGRARRRIYEKEHRKRPDVNARRKERRRQRGVERPDLKREQHKRYKARHPERVKAQQDAANRRRAAEKREYMHLYCTKYVGEGMKPKCRTCGGAVEWNGSGRPHLDCLECRSAA